MVADTTAPDQKTTEPVERDIALADQEEEEEGDGAPRILIVEDNQDLRSYMASDLASEYDILEAVDGTSGLETAIAEIPDLVLSDVMMPGMDGFELCRRLKEDERTCHIPVILLTARAEPESRREGLRQGADDYLAKPFDAEELRLRIRNQIEHRRKLAEEFERKLAALTPDTIPVTSADDKFLTQMREVVDANLEDADLSGEFICREVAMSRSQLHRKLKALTGRSVSDFVRTRRLQRAVQLMDGGYGNVTDITFAVGFRHLSYFSKSFRALYGMQPSEYLKGVAEKKDKGN
jgi:DNA-binding response OmpR family regulator